MLAVLHNKKTQIHTAHRCRKKGSSYIITIIHPTIIIIKIKTQHLLGANTRVSVLIKAIHFRGHDDHLTGN